MNISIISTIRIVTILCVCMCVCFGRMSHSTGFVLPSFLLWGQRHISFGRQTQTGGNWRPDFTRRHEWFPQLFRTDKSGHHTSFTIILYFNGNIYWRLLNNSSCHAYRGVKDHCTVSFFTVFLTVFTSSISADRTHWRSISSSSGWGHLQILQAKCWVPSYSAQAFTKSKCQHTKEEKSNL